jgi:hypothetical protein
VPASNHASGRSHTTRTFQSVVAAASGAASARSLPWVGASRDTDDVAIWRAEAAGVVQTGLALLRAVSATRRAALVVHIGAHGVSAAGDEALAHAAAARDVAWVAGAGAGVLPGAEDRLESAALVGVADAIAAVQVVATDRANRAAGDTAAGVNRAGWGFNDATGQVAADLAVRARSARLAQFVTGQAVPIRPADRVCGAVAATATTTVATAGLAAAGGKTAGRPRRGRRRRLRCSFPPLLALLFSLGEGRVGQISSNERTQHSGTESREETPARRKCAESHEIVETNLIQDTPQDWAGGPCGRPKYIRMDSCRMIDRSAQ